MVGTGIDLELPDHLATKFVLGKHAPDGTLDDRFWTTLKERLEGLGLDTPRVTGVAVLDLGLALVRRDVKVLGVDDDNEITTDDVRSVGRLVLATQNLGNH